MFPQFEEDIHLFEFKYFFDLCICMRVYVEEIVSRAFSVVFYVCMAIFKMEIGKNTSYDKKEESKETHYNQLLHTGHYAIISSCL